MIGIAISYTKKRCIADCSAMHFFYSLLKFCMWFKYGLKAQKLLAQEKKKKSPFMGYVSLTFDL